MLNLVFWADYSKKCQRFFRKPREIVIILVSFTSLALLFFANDTISSKSTNLSCTIANCDIPKLSNNEILQISFTVKKIKVNCVDQGRPKSLRIIGICEGKILIATYLTEQMQGFAPGIKISSPENSSWTIEYTKHQIRYIVNNTLAYTHYTPFRIQTEKISLDHKFFEDLSNHINIKLKKREENIPKPLEIFLCVCLVIAIHIKTISILKSNVINYRMRIPPTYLYAISIIWLGVLYQMLSIPRTNVFASLKTPLPTIFFSFSDYWQIFDSAKFIKPYQSFPINYPPFTLSLLKMLGQFGDLFGFLLLIYSGILAIYVCEKRIELVQNRLGNTLLVPIVFFPIIFAIGRANLDLVVSILLFFWVMQLQKNSKLSSVVLLALASSLKIWPSVFLVVYLKNKQFKEFFCSLALFFVFQAVGLLTLGYNVSEWEPISIAKNVLFISNSGTRLELFNSTSLILLFKFILLLGMTIAKGTLSGEYVATLNLLPWQWLQIVMFTSILIVLTIRKNIGDLRLIGVLCFALVLLPNPAYLYRSCIFIVLFYLLAQLKVDLDLTLKIPAQSRVLSHVVGMVLIASSPGTSIFLTSQEFPIGAIQGPIFMLISLIVFLRQKRPI